MNYADKNAASVVAVASKRVHSRDDLLKMVLGDPGIHKWLHDFLRPIHAVVVIQHHQVYSHGVVISYPLRQIAAEVFAPDTRRDLTRAEGWSKGWEDGVGASSALCCKAREVFSLETCTIHTERRQHTCEQR